jgi:serine/threonine protein phosphatase PrpC
VRVETYGASQPHDGSRANEDAFWIQRPAGTVAVVCDGTGNAQGCAQRIVHLFGRQLESGALDVSRFPAWSAWLRSMDASLLGGSESTFVGVAVIENRLLGAYSGDSRAFLVNEHGCRLLTEAPGRRLGSGEADPRPIHENLTSGDVVLLMSDGAWSPLNLPAVQRIVVNGALRHFADLPPNVLEAAGKKGRPDDMTVVAMRVREVRKTG